MAYSIKNQHNNENVRYTISAIILHDSKMHTRNNPFRQAETPFNLRSPHHSTPPTSLDKHSHSDEKLKFQT